MKNEIKTTAGLFQALSNPHRLQIMMWLKDPRANFPPQQEGDLVDDGVCVGFITEKTGLKQPTVTRHMQILTEAGLVSSKQIKNWVFYKSDDDQFDGALEVLGGLKKGACNND